MGICQALNNLTDRVILSGYRRMPVTTFAYQVKPTGPLDGDLVIPDSFLSQRTAVSGL
jgi:hypothetical protein